MTSRDPILRLDEVVLQLSTEPILIDTLLDHLPILDQDIDLEIKNHIREVTSFNQLNSPSLFLFLNNILNHYRTQENGLEKFFNLFTNVDDLQNTALHKAVEYNNTAFIHVMLQLFAKVKSDEPTDPDLIETFTQLFEETNSSHQNPLEFAIHSEKIPVIHALIYNDLNIYNDNITISYMINHLNLTQHQDIFKSFVLSLINKAMILPDSPIDDLAPELLEKAIHTGQRGAVLTLLEQYPHLINPDETYTKLPPIIDSLPIQPDASREEILHCLKTLLYHDDDVFPLHHLITEADPDLGLITDYIRQHPDELTIVNRYNLSPIDSAIIKSNIPIIHTILSQSDRNYAPNPLQTLDILNSLEADHRNTNLHAEIMTFISNKADATTTDFITQHIIYSPPEFVNCKQFHFLDLAAQKDPSTREEISNKILSQPQNIIDFFLANLEPTMSDFLKEKQQNTTPGTSISQSYIPDQNKGRGIG